MPTLTLHTRIAAPAARCFDLARDVDLHLRSADQTQEKAVAGKTSGRLELEDVVTWQGVHFGFRQHLTVRITEFEKPRYFCDVMERGAFPSLRHEHWFEPQNEVTLMTDHFSYAMPFGFVGWCFDQLFLRAYLRRFLMKRNQLLKQVAETAA